MQNKKVKLGASYSSEDKESIEEESISEDLQPVQLKLFIEDSGNYR